MGASSYIEDSRQSRRVSKGLIAAVVALPLLLLNAIAFYLGLYSSNSCDTGASCGSSFNPMILLGTVVITFAYLAIAYAGSTRASLAFTGASKADDTYSEARSLLENVSIAAGVPTPSLYIVQDSAPNAFAVGTNPKNAAVAVTTGLLSLMNRRELEGVLAHELAHIKNKDTKVSTIAVLAIALVTTIADISLRAAFHTRSRGKDSNQLQLIMMGIALATYLLAVPSALLLRAALSRQREELADETAVEITRNPAGLRSALEKLEADTTVVSRSVAAVSHLWIESPLERGGKSGILGRLMNTHPPLSSRIEKLEIYEGRTGRSTDKMSNWEPPAA